MQPNHYDLLGQVREPRAASQLTRDGQPRDQHGHPGQSRSSGAPLMRSEDSWIELSSQPSSSSLSSAATNDDIITTGLQVEHRERGMYQHRSRRRRMQHLAAVATAQVNYSNGETSFASSSQEEYEESESESDPPMSSSNEDITPSIQPAAIHLPPSRCSDEADSDDEDDTSTALGMNISPSPFVPQPNVFSHPPATFDPANTRPTESRRSQPSASSNTRRRPSIRRESYPITQGSRRYHQLSHSPYNMISPSHHADHDAALRASLSTLLSCAAAARGIPKLDQSRPRAGPSITTQTPSFRLVGESVAMGDEDDSGEEQPLSPRQLKTSPPVEPSRHRAPLVTPPSSASSKAKRRSASPKDRSLAKKSRRASISDSNAAVSPTVMTWVISAGVVVLFSAISFSAGYMLGREVGRAEMGMMGDGSVPGTRSSAACSQEAVRGGLKRFRWGTAAAAGSVSLA
ncbi:hypothetical protein POX_g08979 [Penicillium oxalicum]|uniref:hypothetical protein n=1 Tax=Penicillium oxalicum TaxID=69781 RepID=UPI0020B7D84E|nr:hypothetical protein POX_g08979 [Penicillium oxalicum]KAI2786592.1 hypothetical protein POX_g08979 [Penicillium oxalicum]